MQNTDHLLEGYSDMEKGAYLGAVASIATADHAATDDELEFIRELSTKANLSPQQSQAVERAATEISAAELQRCLDVLKASELRFSLLADLVAFAQADGKYTDDEKANIEKIAQHLDVSQKQFSLLDEFVQKTSNASVTPQQATNPGFLESLGFGDRFKSAGINMNGLTKGLLGIVGPMLLARMLSGGRSRRSGMGMGRSMGGFGSLISMLNNGRGYRGVRQSKPNIFGF